MTTAHRAIDPELAAALAALPHGANGGLLDLTDIPALRDQLRAAAAQAPSAPLAGGLESKTISIGRSDGTALDVLTVRPARGEEAQPVLLWFHAGGQVLGMAGDDSVYAASLAQALDSVIAVVDYRLAPETPAPGAAEDGLLAFTHLIDHADEHGIDPERIAIAGASGGGAIAAATALLVRDRNMAPPCALSLSYAMLDDRNQSPSSHEITNVGVFDRRENILAWAAVLGERVGRPDVSPYSVPGRATDVAGLAPTFIAAAQYDVFRDEDIDLARRLLEAGVSTDLHVFGGAYHAWDRFAPTSQLTREFERIWHGFLRQHLHPRKPVGTQ